MSFNGNQQSGPITGINPLTYTGNKPNMILMNRRPTEDDIQQFFIGHWWIIPVTEDYPTGEVWVLTSKADGIATWKRLGGGAAAGVETLTGNTGGPVDPLDGNINVVGSGSVVVTGNPSTNTLTITTSGGGGGVVGVNKIVFTSSGNYIKPSNLVQLYVECVGGGGGGFGSGGATSGTSGGSAGGYCAKLFAASQIGTSEAYSVGAGGAGGAHGGNAGSAGGNTTFGGVLTANGGGAGTGYTTINPGGTASGGDINIQGGTGTVGAGFETDLGVFQRISGNGGSSMYGQGGSGVWLGSGSFGAIGNSGTGYGSGPAGNFGDNGGVNIGGANGQPGVIILTEYLS